MAITALLLSSVLFAAPVKLTHTYVKDAKVTYTIDVKVPSQSIEFGGDLTFSTLDDKGLHNISGPELVVKRDGNDMKFDLRLDKVGLDAHGLASNFEFGNEQIAFILTSFSGYLPAQEVTKDMKFEFTEKRENYSMKGFGTLTQIEEKEGKQIATVTMEITVTPGTEANDGLLKVTSLFDVATGQLISADGTLDIESALGSFKIKRK